MQVTVGKRELVFAVCALLGTDGKGHMGHWASAHWPTSLSAEEAKPLPKPALSLILSSLP